MEGTNWEKNWVSWRNLITLGVLFITLYLILGNLGTPGFLFHFFLGIAITCTSFVVGWFLGRKFGE